MGKFLICLNSPLLLEPPVRFMKNCWDYLIFSVSQSLGISDIFSLIIHSDFIFIFAAYFVVFDRNTIALLWDAHTARHTPAGTRYTNISKNLSRNASLRLDMVEFWDDLEHLGILDYRALNVLCGIGNGSYKKF